MPEQGTHVMVYDAVVSGTNLLTFPEKKYLLRSFTEKLWQYFPQNISVCIFPGSVAQHPQCYTVSKPTKPQKP